MQIIVATMRPEYFIGTVWPEWSSLMDRSTEPIVIDNSVINRGVVAAYEEGYLRSSEEILAFIHDDVDLLEDKWDIRMELEFNDPSVGLCGMGGALEHGHKDLYKIPYKLQNLARYKYRSNVRDAEVHGERFTGACDVAVLDGYCLIVRRELLDRAGGWSRICSGCDFFTYDYAISAMARRLGYRIRVVGIKCHHRGGQTSLARSEITSQEAYDRSHRWFYETYRDVMPCDLRKKGSY